MTVIEIRPHRWGWKAFEASGVEPVFAKKGQAIDYAHSRACFRSGEIRIFDSTGNVERVMRLRPCRLGRLGPFALLFWRVGAGQLTVNARR